jgi:hypothetical protein
VTGTTVSSVPKPLKSSVRPWRPGPPGRRPGRCRVRFATSPRTPPEERSACGASDQGRRHARSATTSPWSVGCRPGACRRSGVFPQHSMTLTARPPREVSLYLTFMSAPIDHGSELVLCHSCGILVRCWGLFGDFCDCLRSAVLRQCRTSDRYYGQQVLKTLEVVGVGGEERQLFGDGDGGDH